MIKYNITLFYLNNQFWFFIIVEENTPLFFFGHYAEAYTTTNVIVKSGSAKPNIFWIEKSMKFLLSFSF